MSLCVVFLSLLLFLTTIYQTEARFHSFAKGSLKNSTSADEEMVPMMEERLMMRMDVIAALNDSSNNRRKLGSFQICAACTCCGGGVNRVCLPSPCCYAINCNIPNRPFGFCSFTPKTCNCFGCHL